MNSIKDKIRINSSTLIVSQNPVKKIISGGQTGVDRAGLDIAIECKINYGGWCPLGRLAENGTIPENYKLQETSSSDYNQRTVQNIIDSDGTLIIVPSKLFNLVDGTKLTIEQCIKHKKPHLIVSLTSQNKIIQTLQWLKSNNIETLNIAGPRESNSIGIYYESTIFLRKLFGKPLSHL